MRTSPEPLATALSRLQQRWGSDAVRLGSGQVVAPGAVAPGAVALGSVALGSVARGAVALGAVPDEGALAPAFELGLPPLDDRVVSTGFPELDAILGPGGLVREAGVTLRGGDSSGKTTLALRLMAEAQQRGAIAAYLDLGRAFDPLEAVARGVDLAWLLVLRSANAIEGLQLAGALLGGRTVELLVVDLPARLPANGEEFLRSLAARARRVGARLVVLEPSGLAPSLRSALAETAGVGLELERRSWIRVGRDVVGQRALVTVEKNRFGPPGRRVELEIRYVEEGARERGVARALEEAGRIGVDLPPAVRPAERGSSPAYTAAHTVR